jgi:hypothetical protein
MLHPFRTLPAAILLIASAALLPGCAYKLEGKVVEGLNGAQVTDMQNADAQRGGVPGASIELIRDPQRPTRQRVAQANADKNGRFVLTVDSFGAGWMQERWEIRVRRNGYESIQQDIDLPSSPDGRLVLVGLTRGRSTPFAEPTTTRGLMDEAKKYEPGIGSGSGAR